MQEERSRCNIKSSVVWLNSLTTPRVEQFAEAVAEFSRLTHDPLCISVCKGVYTLTLHHLLIKTRLAKVRALKKKERNTRVLNQKIYIETVWF